MNKIKVFTIFSLIFFFLLNHFIFTAFQIKSYNSIAFIDHDLGYLVEQLLLKLDFLEINRLVSHPAIYGVEFYYLSYLFNFLNFFFNLNPINIFYLVTIFHLTCVFFTFYLVFRLFKKLNIDIFYFVFFVLIIFFSPIYISRISDFKPDANLFMLFIVSTIFFFNNYLKKNKIKNLLYSIFFSVLAFSVKFFGIFFLFSFLFFIFTKKKYKIHFSQIYSNIISFLNIIFITIWLYFFLNFLENGYLDNLRQKKLLNENLINILNFFSHHSLFILFFLFFFGSYFIFFYKNRSIYVKNLSFLLNIFIFFSFLICTPLIFDYKILFSSVAGFHAYTNLTKDASEVLFFSNFVNFLISDFKYGVLNILSIFIIIISVIFRFYKKIILPEIFIFILIFFCLMIFIMPLIWPAVRNYPIRIVIFYLQFILTFLSLSIILNSYKLKILSQFALCFFTTVSFIFLQNFNNVNIFKLYSKNSLIQNQVKELNIKLIKYQNTKSNFYFCGGFFPYYLKNNYFQIMNSNCLSENFLKSVSKNDYIIIALDHIYPADFLIYEKRIKDKIIYNYGNITGVKTTNNGRIIEITYTVLKVKN